MITNRQNKIRKKYCQKKKKLATNVFISLSHKVFIFVAKQTRDGIKIQTKFTFFFWFLIFFHLFIF